MLLTQIILYWAQVAATRLKHIGRVEGAPLVDALREDGYDAICTM
jgi:hypothetical protein